MFGADMLGTKTAAGFLRGCPPDRSMLGKQSPLAICSEWDIPCTRPELQTSGETLGCPWDTPVYPHSNNGNIILLSQP